MEPVLSQLAPFNEHRFKLCIQYLSAYGKRTLTQYDIVKLHVLIDVFHVLEHGQPIIGGQLCAWEHGPVVKKAYNRAMHWYHAYMDRGELPEGMSIGKGDGRRVEFTATQRVDPVEFSDAEIESMLRAYHTLMDSKRTWKARDEYFHGPDTFLGRAWGRRWKSGTRDIEISWDDVIDEYAKDHPVAPEHVQRIKRAIRL